MRGAARGGGGGREWELAASWRTRATRARPHLAQAIAPSPGIRVLHADPREAVDTVQRLEQVGELGSPGKIDAPTGRVLTDEIQLLHAVGGQPFRLRRQVGDRPAA